MRVLLVGSGGREHALVWKLAQITAPHGASLRTRQPRDRALGQCHPVRADDVEAVLGLARALARRPRRRRPRGAARRRARRRAPLVGIAVFGPSRSAAAIEGSKTFAKAVMAAAGVPTAAILDEPVRALRDQGGRPRRREGRRRLPNAGGRRGGLAELERPGRPARSSRSSRGARGLGLRALRRVAASRCRRRRTSSARSTATRARTPAAWAPSRRSPASTRTSWNGRRPHRAARSCRLARRGTPSSACSSPG